MPVELEIRDGDPWWISPDIWVVPGQNPEGSVGAPIVGQSNFIWARIKNKGTSSVNNAVVRFYWADPSVGFDRNTAHLVGTSNVNLLSNESADVLCLTPWIPEYVNDGHECVLAEAFHSSLDPLPATPDFNVPTDRHVAQRNLSVVHALRGFFAFPFVVHNIVRTEQKFELKVMQGKLKELEPFRDRLGIDLPKREGQLVRTAFVESRCPVENIDDDKEASQLSVGVPGKGSRATTLSGRIEGGAVLVHVGQYRNDCLVGGLSVLVVS